MATKNTATRNRMADDWTSTWDGGTLSIYAMGSGNLLVEFPLGPEAFNAAVNGVATLHNDSKTTQNAVDSGDTHAGVLRSASPGEYELSVIEIWTGEDYPLIISSRTVEAGQPISLLSLSYKEPEGVAEPA